jgi:hypothetical protein
MLFKALISNSLDRAAPLLNSADLLPLRVIETEKDPPVPQDIIFRIS